jgi:hypothetical protein
VDGRTESVMFSIVLGTKKELHANFRNENEIFARIIYPQKTLNCSTSYDNKLKMFYNI